LNSSIAGIEIRAEGEPTVVAGWPEERT
jgi:hypothetical protein